MLTEQQWKEELDPYNLFQAVHQKVSDRKKRLYCCACFKGLKLAELQQQALMVSEQYADGIASIQLWDMQSRLSMDRDYPTLSYALQILSMPHLRIRNLNHLAAHCHSFESDTGSYWSFQREVYNYRLCYQSYIFKSIFNPFIDRRVYKYDNNCINLAKSLYAGDMSAHGPLHDALLDCGHELLAKELAKYDFFKGNFVVDLILGKL